MKNEINDLSEKLTKLQLRRREVIEDLQRVEKEITTVLTKQQENERNDSPRNFERRTPSAIDRSGQFIHEGDRVRVLTSGMYKGLEATVISIVDNKVSFKPDGSNKNRPSWRLSHNLLRIDRSKVHQ